MNEKKKPCARKMILIVGDEINLIQALTFTLKRNGYGVIKSTNKVDAFNSIVTHMSENKPIDLVIVDMQLPVHSGREFIKKLKTNAINVHILIITTHGVRNFINELRPYGHCSFLKKPFDSRELVEYVSLIFRK